MGDAGHRRGASSDSAPEQPSPEVARMVDAYLKLGNGDLRQALALAVTDAMGAAKLVSVGCARWGQPATRARHD